jgi:hypothetical protein
MNEEKYSNSSNENIITNYNVENYNTEDDEYNKNNYQNEINSYNKIIGKKRRKIFKNNGWNAKKENLLKYWKEEAQIIIWLNSEALNSTKFINKCLSIPAIFISAISSASLFSNVNMSEDRINIVIIFIGILLMISTIIQSLKEFLNLDKNIRQYITIIKNNQMLVLEIEEQLNQETYDRENGVSFLKKIKYRKGEMVKNSVEIPSRIYKKLEREIEKGNIINYKDTFILYNYLQKKSTNQVLFNNSNESNENNNNYDNDDNDNDSNNRIDKRNSIHKIIENNYIYDNNNSRYSDDNDKINNKINSNYNDLNMRIFDNHDYDTDIKIINNIPLESNVVVEGGRSSPLLINLSDMKYDNTDNINISSVRIKDNEKTYNRSNIKKNNSFDSSDDNITDNCINETNSNQMKMYAKQIKYQLGRL